MDEHSFLGPIFMLICNPGSLNYFFEVLLVPISAKFFKFPGGSFCGAFWEVF